MESSRRKEFWGPGFQVLVRALALVPRLGCISPSPAELGVRRRVLRSSAPRPLPMATAPNKGPAGMEGGAAGPASGSGGPALPWAGFPQGMGVVGGRAGPPSPSLRAAHSDLRELLGC